MPGKLTLALAGAVTVLPFASAAAQVAESGSFVPLALAEKPVSAAIATREARGYSVSAVVVDTSGVVIAALGVSGSPGGDKDEACAVAGVRSIQGDIASAKTLKR